jgi:hypothetical protein
VFLLRAVSSSTSCTHTVRTHTAVCQNWTAAEAYPCKSCAHCLECDPNQRVLLHNGCTAVLNQTAYTYKLFTQVAIHSRITVSVLHSLLAG